MVSLGQDPGTLRRDPLTGRWVIYAVGRSERPNEFPVRQRDCSSSENCPFCPGHEHLTTPEVVVRGRDAAAPANSPGWRMRTFANMYPALRPDLGADAEPGLDSLYEHYPGVGSHQVVVYSPDHGGGPGTLGVSRWHELLTVLQGRSRELARLPEVRYISVFCNHGPEAGATLAHPHMQIIGAPKSPLLAVAKAAHGAAYQREQGRCMLCDLEKSERAGGTRLITNNELWTVFAPWASRFPWEMLFVPRRHGASLNQAADGELAALAEVLSASLAALVGFHGDLSLNIVVHSTGVRASGSDDEDSFYHWHLEVLPRLSRPAGLEVGTGYTINSVMPEVAAAGLRTEMDRR